MTCEPDGHGGGCPDHQHHQHQQHQHQHLQHRHPDLPSEASPPPCQPQEEQRCAHCLSQAWGWHHDGTVLFSGQQMCLQCGMLSTITPASRLFPFWCQVAAGAAAYYACLQRAQQFQAHALVESREREEQEQQEEEQPEEQPEEQQQQEAGRQIQMETQGTQTAESASTNTTSTCSTSTCSTQTTAQGAQITGTQTKGARKASTAAEGREEQEPRAPSRRRLQQELSLALAASSRAEERLREAENQLAQERARASEERAVLREELDGARAEAQGASRRAQEVERKRREAERALTGRCEAAEVELAMASNERDGLRSQLEALDALAHATREKYRDALLQLERFRIGTVARARRHVEGLARARNQWEHELLLRELAGRRVAGLRGFDGLSTQDRMKAAFGMYSTWSSAAAGPEAPINHSSGAPGEEQGGETILSLGRHCELNVVVLAGLVGSDRFLVDLRHPENASAGVRKAVEHLAAADERELARYGARGGFGDATERRERRFNIRRADVREFTADGRAATVEMTLSMPKPPLAAFLRWRHLFYVGKAAAASLVRSAGLLLDGPSSSPASAPDDVVAGSLGARKDAPAAVEHLFDLVLTRLRRLGAVKALCTSWRGESLDGDEMLERQLRSTQEYVAAFGIRVEMRRVPEQVSRKMEGRLARVIQAAHGHDGEAKKHARRRTGGGGKGGRKKRGSASTSERLERRHAAEAATLTRTAMSLAAASTEPWQIVVEKPERSPLRPIVEALDMAMPPIAEATEGGGCPDIAV